MNNNPIGIFDSGIGGITVLDECCKLLPGEDFVYVSDPRFAPYGNRKEIYITERCEACVSELLHHDCKAVVAACNTATNVGIAGLRQSHSQIFVGLEPALKPAKEQIDDGLIVVLATKATTKQQKFKDLIAKYGGKNVRVLPQSDLASLIESHIDNLDALKGKIAEILEPVSKAKGVVLGCTHYVFIKHLIADFYGGDVQLFDGNQGAARQLKKRLSEENLLSEKTSDGQVKFISL